MTGTRTSLVPSAAPMGPRSHTTKETAVYTITLKNNVPATIAPYEGTVWHSIYAA